jgi:hypothetical protein
MAMGARGGDGLGTRRMGAIAGLLRDAANFGEDLSDWEVLLLQLQKSRLNFHDITQGGLEPYGSSCAIRRGDH